MRFTKRRNEFLLRRWAGKHGVAAVLGIDDVGRVEIGHTPDGAPRALVDGRATDLTISLTDRAGWAVCLVGNETIGCDLELAEARSPGFVHDFLTPAEQAYVASTRDTSVAANLIWSAKESVLKVLHAGLRRDTRDVEVTVHSGQSAAGWGELSVLAVDGRRFGGWWRHDGQFLLTVAADAPPGESGALAVPVALEDPLVLAGAVPIHSWMGEPSRAPEHESGTAATPVGE